MMTRLLVSVVGLALMLVPGCASAPGVIANASLGSVAVPVTDLEAAVDFYSALLDGPGTPDGSGRHVFALAEGALVCVDDATPTSDRVHVTLEVSGVSRFVERARSLPCLWVRTDGRRSARLGDPFGNTIELRTR